MPDFPIPNLDLLTLLRGQNRPLLPASAVGSSLGRSQTMAASNDPALNPDEDVRIGINAGNRFAATETGLERSGTAGQARDPNDQMPIATGRMNDLSPQPGGGAISALLNSLRAAPPVPLPAAEQRQLPGPGFIPGAVNLNPRLAPQVPAGVARPLAPGEFVRNPDGGVSSEITMTVQGDKSFNDGKATVIPSLWIKDGKPYVAATEDEAVELAKASGLTWPSFESLDQAEQFANAREARWQQLSPQAAYQVAPLWTSPAQFIEPPGRAQ